MDSLNGLASHTFGQPLSAFPAMARALTAQDEITRIYAHLSGPASGWCAQHWHALPHQSYLLPGRQCCHFQAVSNAATRRAEALYLLGPGLAQAPDQLFWEGRRARAA